MLHSLYMVYVLFVVWGTNGPLRPLEYLNVRFVIADCRYAMCRM